MFSVISAWCSVYEKYQHRINDLKHVSVYRDSFCSIRDINYCSCLFCFFRLAFTLCVLCCCRRSKIKFLIQDYCTHPILPVTKWLSASVKSSSPARRVRRQCADREIGCRGRWVQSSCGCWSRSASPARWRDVRIWRSDDRRASNSEVLAVLKTLNRQHASPADAADVAASSV